MKHLPPFRTYGASPYSIAVLHGGPGACGEMAQVAHELATRGFGVLESLETGLSIERQICELHEMLATAGNPPFTLIGHSWGAWLGGLFAAHHPELVRKLILVASGPFDATYAQDIDTVRMNRLTPAEQSEAQQLIAAMRESPDDLNPELFARFGALMDRADTFDPLPDDDTGYESMFRPGIFRAVWPEAAELRASGELLDAVRRIACPVVAIHGDHDPHPAAGVREPLVGCVLQDFRFVLLERCGHTPWRERHAREEFYRIVNQELPERII